MGSPLAPEAWAGYRFVAVCEHHPIEEVLPELGELAAELRREFEAIVAGERSRNTV